MPYGDRNRPREIFPATPFLFLQTRGNIELQWSTNVTFVWTDIAVNTQDFEYVPTKSKIFVLTSGYYEISYDLSVYLYSGVLDYMYMEVLQNSIRMQGSRTYASFATEGTFNLVGHYYTYLNKGDYIQLHSVVGTGGGVLRTKTESVRFIIKFVAQEGWNNSRGGATNYRGGVSR